MNRFLQDVDKIEMKTKMTTKQATMRRVKPTEKKKSK